jgi:nucleoside-diphosphate kinase
MSERTLMIIKPDGIQRHLVGEIISRFEKKGFKLVGAKFTRISDEQAQEHYAVHKDKDFYEGAAKYLASGPVLLMVWEAEGIIEMSRKMMGSTFGYSAEPGTIRGDFGNSTLYNLVHGSDSVETAECEINLFFKPEELVSYEFADKEWLYGKTD